MRWLDGITDSVDMNLSKFRETVKDRERVECGCASRRGLTPRGILECNPEIPVLEKTLESPLDCKEIQPVHSEGDQPWVSIGRNDEIGRASCRERV